MIKVIPKITNEIETGVWSMFDAGMTETQIIERFKSKYGVAPEHIYEVRRTGYTMMFAGPIPKKESEE